MIGYPTSAEGVLVSGGSMANFTALAAARRGTTPGNVREDGLAGPDRPRLTVYASDQTHACVDKAVDLLGIGTRQLRKIETDERFRIRVPELRAAIAEDRAAGFQPAIVVGNAGTVNTGAIDPLDEIAEICRAEGLWFHADGAYGALASMVPELKPLFAGMEKADSVAVDPHKWLYVPYEAGATLVRDPGRLSATFRKFPEYLASDPESPFPGPAWFAERGVELSRGFKALKVWMGIQTHGRRAYVERIASDIALARFLSGRGRPAPRLRAPRRAGPVDRELPLPAGEPAAVGRAARRAQPQDHQSPRRRRRVLPRPDGAQGPDRAARLDHELPDDAVGPDRAARRGGENREEISRPRSASRRGSRGASRRETSRPGPA